jgi:hypothetical protein
MNDTPTKQLTRADFYRAYGEFIHRFTLVEQRLQDLLWSLTGAEVEIARVVFPNAGQAALIKAVRALHESRGRRSILISRGSRFNWSTSQTLETVWFTRALASCPM